MKHYFNNLKLIINFKVSKYLFCPDFKKEKPPELQELKNKRKSISNLDSYKTEATVSKLKKVDSEESNKSVRYSQSTVIIFLLTFTHFD